MEKKKILLHLYINPKKKKKTTTPGFFLYIFSQSADKLEYFHQNIMKTITADEAISCYSPLQKT